MQLRSEKPAEVQDNAILASGELRYTDLVNGRHPLVDLLGHAVPPDLDTMPGRSQSTGRVRREERGLAVSHDRHEGLAPLADRDVAQGRPLRQGVANEDLARSANFCDAKRARPRAKMFAAREDNAVATEYAKLPNMAIHCAEVPPDLTTEAGDELFARPPIVDE